MEKEFEEVKVEEIKEDIKENVCKRKKLKKLEIVCGLLTAILFTCSIGAYLLIGFLVGVWHPTWLVFIAPIIIVSLVQAIGEKNAKKFNYPALVVLVYILFSSLFNLWHPLWVLFITIPIYYIFIKFIRELKK